MTLASSPIVAGQLVSRNQLARADRDAMFALLDRHFLGITPLQFERDLSEKNWVILLHAGEQLVGFSTLLVYETHFDRRPISVVCSGDTIVDPGAWSSAALPREWIAGVKRLREHYPRGPYYWLLITSGFRTYRLLSTFWKEFWPRFDGPTPAEEKYLLDTLACERFGDRYDTASGIVRLARPQLLRSHLAGIPAERLADQHVAFFNARNPGHVNGDELACLCELDDSNLTRAGQRMVFGAGGLR
jgi:hypothetical protein